MKAYGGVDDCNMMTYNQFHQRLKFTHKSMNEYELTRKHGQEL
jgi:hypothetical protein